MPTERVADLCRSIQAAYKQKYDPKKWFQADYGIFYAGRFLKDRSLDVI
jgi:hypothetical protein